MDLPGDAVGGLAVVGRDGEAEFGGRLFSWASARASATLRPMRQTSASVKESPWMSADNGSPATNSMTMNVRPSASSKEWIVAMLG